MVFVSHADNRTTAAKQIPRQGDHILQPEWPADKVERRAVAALIPYARNARTHSPEQVDQIAASIREWGWTVPVLVDEQGGIIAGRASGYLSLWQLRGLSSWALRLFDGFSPYLSQRDNPLVLSPNVRMPLSRLQ
jgi:hypothetical protein